MDDEHSPRPDQTCCRGGCNCCATSTVLDLTVSEHACAWYPSLLRTKPLIGLRFRAIPSRPSSPYCTSFWWLTETAFAVAVEYHNTVSKTNIRLAVENALMNKTMSCWSLIYFVTYSCRVSRQQHRSWRRRPMLLTRCSFWQPKQCEDMTLPGRVEPYGPSLSKAPLFAGTWVQIVSKCLRGHHGLGWWLRLKV